jgi:hypothetical protein
MDRVRSNAKGGLHDCLDSQVAFARPRRTDAHRPVGQPRGDRIAIGFRGREYGFNAELAARPNDSRGNLTAIRNQNAPNLHG